MMLVFFFLGHPMRIGWLDGELTTPMTLPTMGWGSASGRKIDTTSLATTDVADARKARVSDWRCIVGSIRVNECMNVDARADRCD